MASKASNWVKNAKGEIKFLAPSVEPIKTGAKKSNSKLGQSDNGPPQGCPQYREIFSLKEYAATLHA
jgi:hypothetical protein